MVIAVSGEYGDDLVKFVWYHLENGRISEREVINAAAPLEALKRQLTNLQIDLLIAGRLSSGVEKELFDSGINLITGVNGRSDDILNSYLNGTLQF